MYLFLSIAKSDAFSRRLWVGSILSFSKYALAWDRGHCVVWCSCLNIFLVKLFNRIKTVPKDGDMHASLFSAAACDDWKTMGTELCKLDLSKPLPFETWLLPAYALFHGNVRMVVSLVERLRYQGNEVRSSKSIIVLCNTVLMVTGMYMRVHSFCEKIFQCHVHFHNTSCV